MHIYSLRAHQGATVIMRHELIELAAVSVTRVQIKLHVIQLSRFRHQSDTHGGAVKVNTELANDVHLS